MDMKMFSYTRIFHMLQDFHNNTKVAVPYPNKNFLLQACKHTGANLPGKGMARLKGPVFVSPISNAQ